MKETYIDFYSLESKDDEESLERSEKQQKQSVFYDAHRILSIGYLETGGTINSEYYMALLDRVSEDRSSYFRDLAPGDYWVFADRNNILQERCLA